MIAFRGGVRLPYPAPEVLQVLQVASLWSVTARTDVRVLSVDVAPYAITAAAFAVAPRAMQLEVASQRPEDAEALQARLLARLDAGVTIRQDGAVLRIAWLGDRLTIAQA